MPDEYATRYRRLLEQLSDALDEHRASANLEDLIASLNALHAEAEMVMAAEDAGLEQMASTLMLEAANKRLAAAELRSRARGES